LGGAEERAKACLLSKVQRGKHKKRTEEGWGEKATRDHSLFRGNKKFRGEIGWRDKIRSGGKTIGKSGSTIIG